MHSEKPDRIARWYAEANNDLVYRHCQAYPEVFRGVAALPQSAGVSPKNCLDELERCVKELGFVGCLLNPDPGEGDHQTPLLHDEWWYPLYEKLVELDVPALLHTAGSKNPRYSYSLNFIIEESIAVSSLLSPESHVFEDFPTLKIIVPHGGGSTPYQMGRWRVHAYNQKEEPYEEAIRKLYFDTCLYTKEAIELLVKTVGSDRVMFGTEKPGSGSAVDPKTGRWMDDLKPTIEEIEFLSDQDKKNIFEDNTHKLYKV
jgi:4-oxalmesaconate hydratase